MLLQGKRVRRQGWREGVYIQWAFDHTLGREFLRWNDGELFDLTVADMRGADYTVMGVSES
jgi:hypothetical protein